MIENINNCLKVESSRNFFIQDKKGNNPAFIKYDDGQFKVVNNTEKNINFLKIDDCVRFETKVKKCDCAVFDDNVFCFIELKTLESDKTTIKAKRRKNAENQLQYTIESFQDEDILKNKKREAYVSLSCTLDDKLTEITNIANKDKELEFVEELDTRLYYSCKKEFK